jgi:pimeloyl-ACP methyl ester carboxylesterase
MSDRRLIYLHGFASSAQSSKGAYLAARAAPERLAFLAPDLNEPEFSTLTISRMVEQVRRLVDAEESPVTLVGSSLGALVAMFAAAAYSRVPVRSAVDTLVLMAPAVDLVQGLTRHFGSAGLREWEDSGRIDVFHYADQRMRPLHWDFLVDARRYDPWTLDIAVPTIVFQGVRDEVVDPETVQRWAASRPNVTLRLLDDSHQLLASLDAMWEDVRRFLPVSA